MSCNVPYGSNSIIGKPSSRVLAAPGGGSSISIGGDIDTSTSNQDRSPEMAMQTLMSVNQSYQAGNAQMGEMVKLNGFPLFEGEFDQFGWSDMGHANRKKQMGAMLAKLNAACPQGAAPAPCNTTNAPQAAPQAVPNQSYAHESGVIGQGNGAGPSRTQCVGGVADNSIGEVPSVKIHAPPGGASSISFG